MLVSKKGDSRPGWYLLAFMLTLLLTEIVGLKFAGAGYTVIAMAIEGMGAFVVSKRLTRS